MILLTQQQTNILSHLFSSKVVLQLAKGEGFSFLTKLLEEAKLTRSHTKAFATLGSFFDVVFQALNNSQARNEYIYKSAIAHKRLLGVHSLNTAILLNEFRAGVSKADAVVLNGTSTVYEIKSERDSLARLASQLTDYQKVFARTNVITSEKQVASVLAAVPEQVGVLCLTKRYQISTIREATEQPELLRSVSMFNSLRRNEAQIILENIGVDFPEVPNTLLHQELSKLFKELDPLQVHSEMVKVLKVTRSQAQLKDFIAAVPKSLQAAALSVPLKQAEQKNFLEVINKPLGLITN